MKLSLRKSLWWLLPLIVMATFATIYVSLRHRRNVQDQIAEEITRMGGTVDVRNQAPDWLFHLASDSCRSAFRKGEGSTWGAARFRNSVSSVLIDPAVTACDVANSLRIRVDERFDPSDEVRIYWETLPENLSRLLQTGSRLNTLKAVEVRCVKGCQLDTKLLPPFVETLEIDIRTNETVTLDLSGLPSTFAHLIVKGNCYPTSLHTDFSRLPDLHYLQSISLNEVKLELDDPSLKRIAKCSTLRSLSLGDSVISDAILTQIRGLPELEYLQIYGPKLTDTGLRFLKDFPKLATAKVELENIDEQTLAELRRLISQLTIQRIPKPDEGFFQRMCFGEGIMQSPENGFERSR